MQLNNHHCDTLLQIVQHRAARSRHDGRPAYARSCPSRRRARRGTVRVIVRNVPEPHGPFRGSATRVIDREGECRLLDQLVAAVRGGESRALVLHGEAGVVKTALLEYLSRRGAHDVCQEGSAGGGDGAECRSGWTYESDLKELIIRPLEGESLDSR